MIEDFDILTFEKWSMNIGITFLITYMMFIIYQLGKESKAGKFGFFILFLCLGLGMFGFVAKTIIVEFMPM